MEWRRGNRDEGKEFQLLDAWRIQGEDFFLGSVHEEWDFLGGGNSNVFNKFSPRTLGR